MKPTVEELAAAALQLPSAARAELADRLVESLDLAQDGDLGKLWAAEAVRRRDEIRQGQVSAVPARQARKRLRQALGQ